jgi:alkaline phosphatase D
VCIRLNAPGQRVRLVVGTNAQLSPALFSAEGSSAAAAGNVVSLNMGGLQPSTAYFFGVEIAGVLRSEPTSRGRFRTFPQGAGSFKIALIGDGDYRDPDHRVYDAVLAEDPLLLLFNGDLHYSDISTTVVEDYRVVYDNILKHPVQGALFRGAPIAYMWDDHDFAGGDNSNGTAAGGAAARTAYREYVPHYPLAVSDGTIGQAFTVGRVRVIMTDLRSASVPPASPETAGKTKLGVAQKAWFKQELIGARDAGFPLILWLCTVPWIGPATLGDDSWAGYTTERTEMANFIRDNRIKNLVVYGGDMHALAYDDGTHSDYATGGGAPLVVLHAAPLTRDSNIKGGPYTAGPFLGTQQYGILEVTDTGGASLQCRFSGKRLGEGAKLIVQFAASLDAIELRGGTGGDPIERVLVNLAARGRISSSADTLIAGFVVGGRTPRNILMRGVGPSLAAFGVTDAIPQPMLALFRGSTLLASNENWGLADAGRLTAAFDRVGAFRFLSTASRDAALYLTLEPGSYTVQASSANGALGSVLLEVYEVP